MKKAFILLLYAVVPFMLFSQTWLWVQQGKGADMTDVENGYSVVKGNNGNIYCAGSYSGATISVGTTNLPTGGLWNMYICAYDSNGNLLNVTTATGSNMQSDQVQGLITNMDNSGNMFVCGYCSGQTLFDNVFVNGGGLGYIAKYDSNARCLWVKTGYSQSVNNCLVYNNNIYSTGSFSSIVSSVDTFILYNPQGLLSAKGFAAEVDTNGTPLWVTQTYGGYIAISLYSAENGHLYFTGSTDSCFIFDTINKCSQPGIGFNCVIQADTDGKVQWTNYSFGNGHFRSGPLSTDVSGNCYVTGAFNQTFYIVGDTLYNNVAQYDGYLAKYNSSGALVWTKQFNSNNKFSIYSIYTDNNGNSYISGTFAGMAVFGNDTITAQSSSDLFVTRYDSSGVCLGVVTVPNAIGTYITGDQSGNAIVTGYITASTSFGSYNLTCNDGGDFFVAKMGAITGTGLRDVEVERLQIYANPNTGTFTVVVPQTIIGASRATLSIYNNNGSLISQQAVDLSNNKVEVELGTVNKGIYNVALSSGQKSFSGSVVIQ